MQNDYKQTNKVKEEEQIEEFNESIRTVVPADHSQEENEHPIPNQRSQLPLGRPPPSPPPPMTPPPIPVGQVVTCAGNVVNTPERYCFEDYTPEATMCDAPPWPPTQEPQPLAGLEGSQWANSSEITVEGPKSYRQARVSPQWSDWKRAMDEELKSLKENDVWDVIPKPVETKIVASRWVYEVKQNAQGEVERYKAQLVANRFSHIHGQDYYEIVTPLVRYDSRRLLLPLSAYKGWWARQLNIKTTFLYWILKEEVYLDLPAGSRLNRILAKFKRCIYGSKQFQREWYYRLVGYLGPFRFGITAWDPCVLVHKSGDICMAIYVEDITRFGATRELNEPTMNILKTEFKINNLGEVSWILQIQITFTNDGITLSQMTFIDKILIRFSVQDCKPASAPINSNHQFRAMEDPDKRTDALAYQQILGSLMYLVTGTWPDLAYTITHHSEFNSSHSTKHLAVAKQVLWSLQGTKNRHVLYPWSIKLKMAEYMDASYDNCLDTWQGFSGYIIQVAHATISWRCRKQQSIAASPCEAEYMALAVTMKHHLWLKRGIQELLKINIPNVLFCDSNAATDAAYNPKLNDRSKHIDVAYHFTRELINQGNLSVMSVPSEQTMADIFTQGMTRYVNDHLCSLMFGSKWEGVLKIQQYLHFSLLWLNFLKYSPYDKMVLYG